MSEQFYKVINKNIETMKDPFTVNGFLCWSDKEALINAIAEGVYGNPSGLRILTVELDIINAEDLVFKNE